MIVKLMRHLPKLEYLINTYPERVVRCVVVGRSRLMIRLTLIPVILTLVQ